jgi:hypothetical protein
MSIAVRLQNAVDTAFLKLSDLVYPATLISRKQSGFDWNTNKLTGSASTRPVEVIFYNERKKTAGSEGDSNLNSSPTIIYKALIRSVDFDMGLYSQIKVENDIYEIDEYEDHLVIVELTLKRVSR